MEPEWTKGWRTAQDLWWIPGPEDEMWKQRVFVWKGTRLSDDYRSVSEGHDPKLIEEMGFTCSSYDVDMERIEMNYPTLSQQIPGLD